MITDFAQQDGDLDLSSGDIYLAGEYATTAQHKADILSAAEGDFRESPLTGVGIIEYINSEDRATMLRAISRQMAADGIAVEKVGFEDGELLITGSYVS